MNLEAFFFVLLFARNSNGIDWPRRRSNDGIDDFDRPIHRSNGGMDDFDWPRR